MACAIRGQLQGGALALRLLVQVVLYHPQRYQLAVHHRHQLHQKALAFVNGFIAGRSDHVLAIAF